MPLRYSISILFAGVALVAYGAAAEKPAIACMQIGVIASIFGVLSLFDTAKE